MTTLTKEQINKKIMQYMGDKRAVPSNIDELSEEQKRVYLPYTYSLDALVEVWEKMCINGGWFNINRHGLDHYQVALIATQVHSGENPWESADDKTIQHAAALATYRAIIELEGE